MTRGPFEDTAVHDPVPIQVAEARRIQAQYGATTVWFGYFTREWWAYIEDAGPFTGALVGGANPARLGEAILAARRSGARRWAR